ncbi:unnamed protein product [Prunus armeniaca]
MFLPAGGSRSHHRRHTPPFLAAPVPKEPQPLPLPVPPQPRRHNRRFWPENEENGRIFARLFNLSFSFLRPPFPTNELNKVFHSSSSSCRWKGGPRFEDFPTEGIALDTHAL